MDNNSKKFRYSDWTIPYFIFIIPMLAVSYLFSFLFMMEMLPLKVFHFPLSIMPHMFIDFFSDIQDFNAFTLISALFLGLLGYKQIVLLEFVSLFIVSYISFRNGLWYLKEKYHDISFINIRITKYFVIIFFLMFFALILIGDVVLTVIIASFDAKYYQVQFGKLTGGYLLYLPSMILYGIIFVMTSYPIYMFTMKRFVFPNLNELKNGKEVNLKYFMVSFYKELPFPLIKCMAFTVHKKAEDKIEEIQKNTSNSLNLKEGMLYKDSFFTVTNKIFRTPRQTYQVDRLEKIEVRSFFPFIGTAGLLLILLFLSFSDVLFAYESFLILFFAFMLIVSGMTFGTMTVSSKALSEVAAIGFMGQLKSVRSHIEEILENDTSGDRGSLMVQQDNDEEEM